MPTQIAIDMDGVVADWNLSAARVGVEPEYHGEWLRCQDIRVKTPSEVDDKEVRRRIYKAGVAFWADMPPTCERFPGVPSPSEMYHRACRIVGEPNVFFLTAVGDETAPAAAMGKVQWLRRHLGNDFSNFFLCRARNKAKLAAPGRVLIDDHPRNLQEWTSASPSCLGMLFRCVDIKGPADMQHFWNTIENFGY